MSIIESTDPEAELFLTISTFDQIKLKPNSLVVLDIDDTLIYFDKITLQWWRENFEYYYNRYKDFEMAENKTYDKWLEVISKIEPRLTDKNIFSFLDNCRTNNCKVILLTARNPKDKDITIKQLQYCGLYTSLTSGGLYCNTSSTSGGLYFNIDDIYFDEDKGARLKDLVWNIYKDFTDIIFVDDLESNLHDVRCSIQNKQLDLYKFVI